MGLPKRHISLSETAVVCYVHVGTVLLELSPVLTATVTSNMARVPPGQEDVVECLRDLGGVGGLAELLLPREPAVDI